MMMEQDWPNSLWTHLFAPTVWVKDLGSAGCSLTLRKLKWKLATGDYYSRRWLLDLQHYRFVSERGFYLFWTWWLPGCLLTVTSGLNPFQFYSFTEFFIEQEKKKSEPDLEQAYLKSVCFNSLLKKKKRCNPRGMWEPVQRRPADNKTWSKMRLIQTENSLLIFVSNLYAQTVFSIWIHHHVLFFFKRVPLNFLMQYMIRAENYSTWVVDILTPELQELVD